MILTKKHWILIGLIAVFFGGTLIYFGYIKQKPGLAKPQPEQTKPKLGRQIMIPSSLNPQKVIENVTTLPYFSVWKTVKEDPSFKKEWKSYFGISDLGEGIIEYGATTWLESFPKRDGTEVHQINEEVNLILLVYVIKYEKPKFAQEDYNKIGFKVSTIEGVKLKANVGIPSTLEEEPPPHISEQFQQYLLQSNNFIIYCIGLKEAAEDIVIRLIDEYTVK